MTLDALTITLSRKGTIELPEAEDQYQCGKRGTRRLEYTACIEAGEAALDERGFLIDQADVHATVVAVCGLSVARLPSCERLACIIARSLQDQVPEATCITVDVGSGEGRGMRATLRRREPAVSETPFGDLAIFGPGLL